jgi:hypothetical protein
MTPIEGLVRLRIGPALRAALCLGVLALLSACGTSYQNSAYRSHHSGDYAPPGPPEDPWGPYIHEASDKYHVPEKWIRAVMRQESGGREYLNGHPITSNAGAMGLMQVMPSTYAGLADRYGLGGDPYDPHDNIMAGAAYIREMYDQFGSPGFLAAYNAGPGRLSGHLATGNPLPSETVQYVASIAPRLGNEIPASGPLAAYAGNERSNRAYEPPATVQLASAAPANPNGSRRSLAQEAAWQTGGQPRLQVASAAAPGMSPAQDAAWQTSPAQYSGFAGSGTAPAGSTAADAAWQTAPAQYAGSGAAPAAMPAPPARVLVASAEPVPSAMAAAPLPPPVPFGAASRPSGSLLMASARADELPPSMRYAPVPASRYSAEPSLPMPPPPPGPGLLGTIPISRDGTPEPPMPPRLQLASATPGMGHFYGGNGGGSWTIQVGAYANASLAHAMAENARHLAPEALRGAQARVGAVTTASGGTLYRARLTGLSSASASAACARLEAGRMSCAALPPDEKW